MPRSITDPRRVDDALARLGRFLRVPGLLIPEELALRGWIAVPVESGSHFTDEDARGLARAIGRVVQEHCLAVVTDDIPAPARVFEVNATREGLLEFSQELGALNVAMISDEGEHFVVLCSVDDYFLVAGPLDFVSAALTTGISEARSAFDAMARDEAWPAAAREKLMSVAKIYGATEAAARVQT